MGAPDPGDALLDSRRRQDAVSALGFDWPDIGGVLDKVAEEVIVHCQVGLRGYLAARTLAQHGRRVRNLDGGYRTWARI